LIFLTEKDDVACSLILLQIHSKHKFKLQVCGQLTSQNEDQTQAPTSSGTDNDEVFKHMRRTEMIKHLSILPGVGPIWHHRHPKEHDHMYK
jgi:hypothetical protein